MDCWRVGTPCWMWGVVCCFVYTFALRGTTKGMEQSNGVSCKEMHMHSSGGVTRHGATKNGRTLCSWDYTSIWVSRHWIVRKGVGG